MSQSQPQDRRPSAASATASVTIPRAPPLPAPRPLRLARDAASRFLGYSSRQSSPPNERESDRFANGTARIDRQSFSARNATASHKTGLEINTISMNEKGTHALVGGKEIFKTIKIEDGRCVEDFNLRTAIRSAPTQASGQPRQIYSIDIADVAWARGDCGDYVVAATSSGKIIMYDLGHAALQAAQLHEHFRQVHKVTFNPHRGNLLLSGSQDGTVRLWDLRDVRRQASTIQSKRKYSGQSDGVRDVKWSPTEGLDFAFGTDTGEVQRWDMRNLKSAKVKVPAHILACNAIDWHPDGKHLLSASSDKTVRVFDVSTARTKRANWEIRTPYPIMNARWRPSFDSSVTQIVTSYDAEHPMLHIWDFRRPHLPFREFEPYASAPSDLIWHSQDLLWSVGREGVFLQTDIQFAQKVMDRRNLQTIAVSPLDELTYVSQVRKTHRVRTPQAIAMQQSSSSLGTSPEMDLFGRSWGDDSLDESFLSVLPAKLRAQASNKRRVSSIGTGASFDKSQPFLDHLDSILSSWKSFIPRQTASRGQLPSHNNVTFVAFQARNCQAVSPSHLSGEEFIKAVEKAFENNARIAKLCGLMSLCKTWKITEFWAVKHLEKRFKLHRERKHRSPKTSKQQPAMVSIEDLSSKMVAQHVKSPTPSPSSQRLFATIPRQLTAQESTSNVPTPLARPTTANHTPTPHQSPLPDIDNEEAVILPPSLAKNDPETSTELVQTNRSATEASATTRRLTEGNLQDLDSFQSHLQATDRIDLVRKWNSQPKTRLTLDSTSDKFPEFPPKLEKHNSNESFQFLEGLNESTDPSLPASSGSGGSDSPRMVSEHPSRSRRYLELSKVERESTSEHEVVSTAHQSMLFEGSGTLANSTAELRSSNSTMPASIEGTNVVRSVKAKLNDLKNQESSERGYFPNQAPEVVNSRTLSRAALSTGVSVTATTTKDENINETRGQSIRGAIPGKRSVSPDVGHLQNDTDFDVEDGSPWTLIEMLRELITHYTVNQPYPQAAALLLLNLGQFLPRTHPLSPNEVYQTVDCYVEYFLTSLGWNTADIPSTMSKCFAQPLKSGLQPLQIESILSTYHDELLVQRQYDEANVLRKLAYPGYPALYEDFIKHNDIHLKCGQCGKPIVTGMSKLRCETCDGKQGMCPICWLHQSPYDADPQTQRDVNYLSNAGPGPAFNQLQANVFSACLICNHSTHVACGQMWFGEAGGDSCPMEGCLCDCVAGAWREEKLEIAHKRHQSRRLGKVRPDAWKARESKAVRKVRAALSA